MIVVMFMFMIVIVIVIMIMIVIVEVIVIGMIMFVIHLEHVEQVNNKHKCLAALNHPAGTLTSVTHIRRNCKSSTSTDFHPRHAIVPPSNYLSSSKTKVKRLVPVPGGIKLAAIAPRHSDIVHRYIPTPRRFFSRTDNDVVDNQFS